MLYCLRNFPAHLCVYSFVMYEKVSSLHEIEEVNERQKERLDFHTTLLKTKLSLLKSLKLFH